MANVLLITSFVTTSRVGGVLQSLALGLLGVEPHLAPTVIFGRHPGLGDPGGGAVGPQTFASVLAAAEANGALEADAILTGYFALPEQIRTAADAIGRARSKALRPIVVVDPILGDEDVGVYVKPEVERGVIETLLPLADLLTPNLFELTRLVGGPPPKDPQGALAAARRLQRPVLVSSVPCGADQIGALYVDGPVAWLATHAKAVQAPRGAGDLLAALFTAARIHGEPVQSQLARAVGGLADAVEAALAGGLSDLPLAALGGRLSAASSRVALTALS